MPRAGQITSSSFPKRRNHEGHPLCRFCGVPVPARRQWWCGDACVRAFWLIVNPKARMDALVKARFGELGKARCADCGKGYHELVSMARSPKASNLKNRPADYHSNMVLELDHIVELADGGCWWSTWNLQLLCWLCHRKKTALSATRRAQARREQAYEKRVRELEAERAGA